MTKRALKMLVALALLGACDEFPGTPPCSDDTGCGAGYRCDTATSDCVVAEVTLEDKTQIITAPLTPKIDFLFVVDNSGSMCEEQNALALGFAEFGKALLPDSNSPVDFRVAVVSTDLRTAGDRGAFIARPQAPDALSCQLDNPIDLAACDVLVQDGALPTVLVTSGEGKNVSDLADFAQKFQCLVSLGTGGDGFENGLEAMRLALSCDGPNAARFGACCSDGGYNPACTPSADVDFLRPDAVLSVVVLSDKDDCSDPASHPAASKRAICKFGPTDGDGDGVPDGFADANLCAAGDAQACFQEECDGLAADACFARLCAISRSDDANCEWNRDTLTPVHEYVDFLKSLKADPGAQLLVTTIVGERAVDSEGYEISYNPPGAEDDPRCDVNDATFDATLTTDQCCKRGRCPGAPQAGCESPFGVALAGKRYLQFSESFGTQGLGCPRDAGDGDCISLCRDPINTTAAHFQRQLVSSFPSLSTFCLDETPACRVGDKRCMSTAERRDPANYKWSVRVKCDEGCEQDFEPVLDSANSMCKSGIALTFGRPVPPGAEIQLRFAPDVDPDLHIAVPVTLPLPIPDEGDVKSPLTEVLPGHVVQAAIHVTIQHGERSDLRLTISHGGKSQILYAGEEQGEDLERVFDATEFIGEDAEGEWTLEVADEWPRDEGRLERWALEVKLAQ